MFSFLATVVQGFRSSNANPPQPEKSSSSDSNTQSTRPKIDIQSSPPSPRKIQAERQRVLGAQTGVKVSTNHPNAPIAENKIPGKVIAGITLSCTKTELKRLVETYPNIWRTEEWRSAAIVNNWLSIHKKLVANNERNYSVNPETLLDQPTEKDNKAALIWVLKEVEKTPEILQQIYSESHKRSGNTSIQQQAQNNMSGDASVLRLLEILEYRALQQTEEFEIHASFEKIMTALVSLQSPRLFKLVTQKLSKTLSGIEGTENKLSILKAVSQARITAWQNIISSESKRIAELNPEQQKKGLNHLLEWSMECVGDRERNVIKATILSSIARPFDPIGVSWARIVIEKLEGASADYNNFLRNNPQIASAYFEITASEKEVPSVSTLANLLQVKKYLLSAKSEAANDRVIKLRNSWGNQYRMEFETQIAAMLRETAGLTQQKSARQQMFDQNLQKHSFLSTPEKLISGDLVCALNLTWKNVIQQSDFSSLSMEYPCVSSERVEPEAVTWQSYANVAAQLRQMPPRVSQKELKTIEKNIGEINDPVHKKIAREEFTRLVEHAGKCIGLNDNQASEQDLRFHFSAALPIEEMRLRLIRVFLTKKNQSQHPFNQSDEASRNSFNTSIGIEYPSLPTEDDAALLCRNMSTTVSLLPDRIEGVLHGIAIIAGGAIMLSTAEDRKFAREIIKHLSMNAAHELQPIFQKFLETIEASTHMLPTGQANH